MGKIEINYSKLDIFLRDYVEHLDGQHISPAKRVFFKFCGKYQTIDVLVETSQKPEPSLLNAEEITETKYIMKVDPIELAELTQHPHVINIEGSYKLETH